MSSSTAEAELNEDERAGLEFVRKSGGIHQSDFWKELEFSSRKGSRIIESLVEKDLVNREEAVYKGPQHLLHLADRTRPRFQTADGRRYALAVCRRGRG